MHHLVVDGTGTLVSTCTVDSYLLVSGIIRADVQIENPILAPTAARN